MKKCTICNSPHKRASSTCQRCYQYNRKHPEGRYFLPPYGLIQYASNGDPICHICGEAHSKLGSHILNFHFMYIKDYKDMFGLLHSEKLTNKSYQNKMRQYTKKYYRRVVKKNLLKHGRATRFQIGQEVIGRGKHKETIR